MSASDLKTISDLVVGPAGALVLAVIVILALARCGWWLLMQVLESKDAAIAYRDEQVTALRGQITRQQDLFDGAMKLVEDTTRRGARRGG